MILTTEQIITSKSGKLADKTTKQAKYSPL